MSDVAQLRKQLDFASRLAKNHIQFVCLPVEALAVVMHKESLENLVKIAARLADMKDYK